MAETRSQSFVSRIQAFEDLVKEQNQEIDRKFSEMLEAIRLNRFEKVLDDPIAELKQLKETNGIVEYHKKFELLSTRVNMTEDYLVRVYLDGLQIDTQVNVQMFQPQTIQQCFLIGRLYEHAHPRSNEVAKDTKVVEIEVNTEVETKSIEKRAHEAILKEDLIQQFQVPVSNLESSLRFHNASPVVCEDSHSVVVGCDELFNHQETILQASYTKARDVLLQKSKSVTNNQVAHQVFETLPHREQSKQRHIKCAKWWKFKFKQRRPHKGRPRIAHKWIYRGDFRYKYLCTSAKVALLKHNKLPESWSTLKDDCFMEDKFWKFKFMNRNLQMMREHGHTRHLKLMSDKREHEAMFIATRTVHVRCLLGIMLGILESTAGHGQQVVSEQILMVNERLLQTSLVLEQAMRNKKLKFSKRWWFKYKSVEEAIKRLHIQLRYKCMLEFEEWLRSWGNRESWRNHNLEASHIQSSFAFNDFQAGFGVDIIILHGVQQQGCRILMLLHLKKRGRFRPLQSFSRLILLALLNLWFSKTYKISGLLKDSSDDGAKNSPVLNFVAEQPLLWLQNYFKKIHIVSELEKKKKKICYTSWMFKYKAPLKSIHDKLGKPKDRGALLIQQFKIKHKWRFKLLLSILALVKWKAEPVEEATWEFLFDLKLKFPHFDA